MTTRRLLSLTPFTGCLLSLASFTAAGPLRVVELVVVALLGERIGRALERGNDLVLRVPLGVQEGLGLVGGAQDHVVGRSGGARRVTKATAVLPCAAAALAGSAATAAGTAAHAVLADKLRQLRERSVQRRDIRRGMHAGRKSLAEIARVGRGASALSAGSLAGLARCAAMTTTTMKSTRHVGEAYTLGQGSWRA